MHFYNVSVVHAFSVYRIYIQKFTLRHTTEFYKVALRGVALLAVNLGASNHTYLKPGRVDRLWKALRGALRTTSKDGRVG